MVIPDSRITLAREILRFTQNNVLFLIYSPFTISPLFHPHVAELLDGSR